MKVTATAPTALEMLTGSTLPPVRTTPPTAASQTAAKAPLHHILIMTPQSPITATAIADKTI